MLGRHFGIAIELMTDKLPMGFESRGVVSNRYVVEEDAPDHTDTGRVQSINCSKCDRQSMRTAAQTGEYGDQPVLLVQRDRHLRHSGEGSFGRLSPAPHDEND